MLPFAIFAVLAIVPLAIAPLMLDSDVDPDADDATTDPDPDLPVETPADATFVIGTDPTVTGTDGSDLFELSDDILAADDPIVPVGSIEAGAGDDILALLDPEAATPPEAYAGPTFEGARISAGAGNDTVAASAPNSVITGDEGDDRIEVFNAIGASVSGGDGNDILIGEAFSGPGVTLQGDAGNDIIDGRQMDSVDLFGGDGADTILTGQPNQPGAGYAVMSDGGAGEDQLIYDGAAITTPEFSEGQMTGGADADVFAITFTEGGTLSPDLIPGDGGGTVRLGLVEITDFTAGEDSIVLNPQIESSAYTVGAIRLEPDATAGTTTIVVPYESETELTREVTITVNGTDLTLDDISIAAFETELT